MSQQSGGESNLGESQKMNCILEDDFFYVKRKIGFQKKTLEARRRTRGKMYLVILVEPIIEPAAKEAAYWQLDAVRVIFASMPT